MSEIIKQRSCIKFCFGHDISATETIKMAQNVVFCTQVYYEKAKTQMRPTWVLKTTFLDICV